MSAPVLVLMPDAEARVDLARPVLGTTPRSASPTPLAAPASPRCSWPRGHVRSYMARGPCRPASRSRRRRCWCSRAR
ncbi:hypothetical protein [Nannocystis pusilla]|uniref:hypothetical protein n=1 Tax=Nannocystis pusilla TaxID=889268 RepID=UPI003B7D9931